MTKKEQLYYMLKAFKLGEYDIATFCDAFEDVFYPDRPKDELTLQEWEWFNRLGDIVVRYSPYLKDTKLYPKAYYTDEEVKKAIEKAYSELIKE